mmetsp:Transcript_28330/g.55064  ORF Transcript_28330/g.55064 Transcript_28330/m.55064 type:complete len:447 (-) Transcript_28330:148-1488(-)
MDTKADSTLRPAEEKPGLSLRRLYHPPKTIADWDSEYAERTSEWFELFVDLIMVIAFSRMAEFLVEDYNAHNLGLFLLFFFLFQTSWIMYAMYCTRFFDDSFLHTMYLILYLLGMSGMTIHVGNTDLNLNFTIAMIIQRFSLFLMYFLTARQNDRARAHAGVSSYILMASLAMLVVACFFTNNETVLYTLWILVVVIELPNDNIAFAVLPREKRLPLNIDHMSDRANAFIIAVLGESVVSALQDYSGQRDFERNADFYVAMSLALLLPFSIALLFYHVQPMTREQHAYRQSIQRGFILYYTQCCLAPTLLLVGVAIKFVTKATIFHDEMKRDQVELLFASVGVSLFLIFCVRLSHYWGNHPSADDADDVKVVKWGWWVVVAIWPFIVLSLLAVGELELAHPTTIISIVTALCFGLALTETSITHWLASRALRDIAQYGTVDPVASE